MMSLFRRRHSVWPANGINASLEVSRKQIARPESTRCYPNRRCVPKLCSRSVRLVTLALFPTAALILCVTLALNEATTQSRSSNQVKDLVSKSLEQVGDLVHRLQIERGATVLYVSSQRDADLRNLLSSYEVTDAEIKNITHWRPIDITDSVNADYFYFESKETFQKHISEYRRNVSRDYQGIREPLSFYSEVVGRIIEWFWEDFSSYQHGDEWPSLVAYQLIILAKEQLGVERALGGRFFALGGYDDLHDYIAYMNRTIKGNAFLEEALLFSEEFKEFYITNILQSDLYSRITDMKSEIYINNFTYIEPNVLEGRKWFAEMSDYIDLLLQAQYILTDIINEDLEKSISYRKKEVIFAIILLIISVILSPFILHKIAHQAKQIEDIADKLGKQAIQLSEEKARANRLLYQMLPREIAESLKSSWDVVAEAFKQATIFFSDVVNFTSLCAECAPMQVVAMLNSLYQTLDTRIELYDVYKIETIGDAYVVVSGVPRRNADRHVYEMGCLAIDIRDTVGKLPIPHIPSECFQLRIGLHTGPCAAGVVGHKMPRYCLFGDSVNTAARMESSGKPSKIHISPSTYTALQNYQEVFIVEPRGTIYVKGKGKMETYWLVGKRQHTSPPASGNGADEPIFTPVAQTPAIDVTYVNIPDQSGDENKLV